MLQNKKHDWDSGFSFGSARVPVDEHPSEALPFYPRSCGMFFHPKGHQHYNHGPDKPMVHLFWGIEGRGLVQTSYGEFSLDKDSFFYLLPFESFTTISESQSWRYRWLTFDGDQARSFIESYRIPHHPLKAGKCPEYLFDDFEQNLHLCTTYAWRKMVALICAILAEAVNQNESKNHSQEKLQAAITLCHNRFSDSALNVNALAEKLDINRISLFRLFRDSLNITPSKYIQKLRCQHAVELLTHTELPIQQIAISCGFSDTSYFCRVIKQQYNKIPTDFRLSTRCPSTVI